MTIKINNKRTSLINIISYKDLIYIKNKRCLPKKNALKIIQKLISDAEQENLDLVSIRISNKITLPFFKNASKLTFVKNGIIDDSVQSISYYHPEEGKGTIYCSLSDALKANNLSRTQYYRHKDYYPIFFMNSLEMSLHNTNFDLLQKIDQEFPESILYGSLLADGAFRFRKINQSFTLVQSASPKNSHIEHISYMLYIFSQIPSEFFGDKPFSLYKRKAKSFSENNSLKPTHGDPHLWNFVLSTRALSRFNSYAKVFYPNANNKHSGKKVIPELSHLKMMLTQYETVAHLICQDGSVTSNGVFLSICPNSFKGSVRIAIALRESLNIQCFIKTYVNSKNKNNPYKYIIFIAGLAMDSIFEKTQEIFQYMCYKNKKFIYSRKTSVYQTQLEKCDYFYEKYKNESWLQSNEM